MSLNTTSDVQVISPRSGQRVGFHNPISNELHSPAERETTPLSEAIKLSSEYIATLHLGLTTFLSTLVEQCLKDYAVYFYANEKNKGMRLNTAQVPTSIKKIRLTLHPLEEVKESEDFMALHTQLVAETEALQRKWMTDYAIVVDTWNCNALLRRCHFSICKKLRNAAKAFIAQIGIQRYSEDEAVMDLLATARHTILAPPLPLDTHEFLCLYKEANELRTLPFPTTSILNSDINSDLKTLIDEINNSIHNNVATDDNFPPPPCATIGTARENTSTPSSSLTGSGDGPSAQVDQGQEMQLNQETVSNNSDQSPPEAIPNQATGNSNTLQQLETQEQEQDKDSEPTNSELMNAGNSRSRGEMNTPVGRLRHLISPSTGQASHTTPGTSTPARTTPTPILYKGRYTGYNRMPPPTHRSQIPPQGNPPLFSHNPTPDTGSIFTQEEDEHLDQNLAALDLDEITASAERTRVHTMLLQLYINAIKLPVEKFHATVTLREELQRIKQVTTITPMNSLASKVAAKIHKELPPERPTLVGLIQEETEKKVNVLKRQLQSALDQIETNSKRLKSLQKSQRSLPMGNTTPISQQQSPKNDTGGNWVWSRATHHTVQSSPAVADDSLTTHQAQDRPQIHLQHSNRRNTHPRSTLQINNHQQEHHSERNTPVVNNNAEAARRRKRNAQRLKNKLNGNSSNKK